MIARLRGTVLESRPLQLVVDIGGVGYAVSVPLTERLPGLGEPIDLFTYAVYREDSATVYGFRTPAERDFFVLLVDKVSGIGPKTALGLLTHLPLARLKTAIETADIGTLKAAPGIGKKTAERLLLELKGHGALMAGQANVSGPAADAVAALMSLGYSQADAQKAITKSLDKLPNGAAEELIRLSLKKD